MNTIRLLHRALGELIDKGHTRINDEDTAGMFEEMIAPLVCYERSGTRFKLTE